MITKEQKEIELSERSKKTPYFCKICKNYGYIDKIFNISYNFIPKNLEQQNGVICIDCDNGFYRRKKTGIYTNLNFAKGESLKKYDFAYKSKTVFRQKVIKGNSKKTT